MNRYPGGLRARSEIECIKARLVKEHFTEQCAVLLHLDYSHQGRFEKLPSYVDKELGSDLANKIDSIRLFQRSGGHELVFHVHFETKDACTAAIKKMRKRAANPKLPLSPFILYPMFTSKKRYSLYTIHLPLDSPANALNEIKQALTPTKRVIVDILLGTDDMFNKYNGTASIVLQGENSIIVNLYGKNYTFGPVKDIKGYLYCEHCKFINDHDTNECPDQPQAEEQPDAEEQPKDEKQPEEEFEEIDNNSISNDSTQKITRL